MVDKARATPSPITPAQAAEFIRGRRSVDQFTDDRPDPAIIAQAIDLARWAPNHHLTQPWRFYRLGERSKQAVIELNTQLVAARKGEAVAAAKRQRWQAVPGWLAVTCVESNDRLTAREDYAACACAIQNILLYLHSAGLAGKWTSGEVTRAPEFLSILGAAHTGEYCVGLLWYGYPARRPRSQRKDIASVAVELG